MITLTIKDNKYKVNLFNIPSLVLDGMDIKGKYANYGFWKDSIGQIEFNNKFYERGISYKVSGNNQITVPLFIRRRLNLSTGDVVLFRKKYNKILFKKVRLPRL